MLTFVVATAQKISLCIGSRNVKIWNSNIAFGLEICDFSWQAHKSMLGIFRFSCVVLGCGMQTYCYDPLSKELFLFPAFWIRIHRLCSKSVANTLWYQPHVTFESRLPEFGTESGSRTRKFSRFPGILPCNIPGVTKLTFHCEFARDGGDQISGLRITQTELKVA